MNVERASELTVIRPVYECRVQGSRSGEMAIEIWQLPTPSTPRLTAPELTASLHGRVLEIVEARVLRRLRDLGLRLTGARRHEPPAVRLDEDTALSLALLFRVLAPMKSLDRIRIVADGIDRMSREEAGYWLGMAMHRRNPRRVLAALRVLLTSL